MPPQLTGSVYLRTPRSPTIPGGLTAFQVLRLQRVIQHCFYALRKGDAFRVGVEAAGALGVEQLNGSGAVAPLARRSVDTHRSRFGWQAQTRCFLS